MESETCRPESERSELRRDLLVLLPLAVASYGIQCAAWPLAGGRDYASYVTYYLNFFEPAPVMPTLMAYRTPLAPLFYGLLLEHTGAVATEAATGAVYVLTIAGCYGIGRFWGRGVAIAFTSAMIFYPDFNALYHQISSDAAFASTFVLWLLAIVRFAAKPGFGRLWLIVPAFALMTLARPSSQIYLIFSIVPLFLPRVPLRRRSAFCLAYLAGSLGFILLWSSHNYLRYDDFTVSRTGAAQVPLYRLFIRDRLVSPENGPSTEALAKAVERDLLEREPYRSYGISLPTFFSAGNFRMFYDLVGLSDRQWGWGSDHAILRKAALEAIRRHPAEYLGNVAKDMLDILMEKYEYEAPRNARRFELPQALPDFPGAPPVWQEGERADVFDVRDRIVIKGRSLPRPTEEEEIPASHLNWLASSPDGSIVADWSDVERPVYRIRAAESYRSWKAMSERRIPQLPNRGPHTMASRFQEKLAEYVYPPMPAWILAGLAGLPMGFNRKSLLLTFFLIAAMAGVVLPVASTANFIQFRLPFDPVFILIGMTGILRGGRHVRRRWAGRGL